MASFLTALASIGGQYGQAKIDASNEMAKRQQQGQEMAMRAAQLGMQQQQFKEYMAEAPQRAQESEANLALKKAEAARADVMDIQMGHGRSLPWSVSKGRFLTAQEDPRATDPTVEGMKGVKAWIDQQPKEDQAKLNQTAVSYGATGEDPTAILTQLRQDAKGYQLERDKLRPKVDPIVMAQVGPQPDAASFPQGANDPAYTAAMKVWGANAETVKSRMAEAMSEARGKGYGEWRPGGFLDQEGQLHSGYWGEAIAKGWVPAPQAFQALPREVQMREMMDASSGLRGAINNLQPGDAFTAGTVAQMKAAVATIDSPYVPGIFSRLMNNAASASLNPRQQDFLIAVGQMGERILSVRNVAGMGVGSVDLREAIQATLPGITDGSKAYALAKLTAVDQLLSRLSTGIPRTGINVPPMTPTNAPPPPAAPGGGGTTTLPSPQQMDSAIDDIIKKRTQQRKLPDIQQPVAPGVQ